MRVVAFPSNARTAVREGRAPPSPPHQTTKDGDAREAAARVIKVGFNLLTPPHLQPQPLFSKPTPPLLHSNVGKEAETSGKAPYQGSREGSKAFLLAFPSVCGLYR